MSIWWMDVVSEHLDLSLILNVILGRCIDPDKQTSKQAKVTNRKYTSKKAKKQKQFLKAK